MSLFCRLNGHVFVLHDLMDLKHCAVCHRLEELGYGKMGVEEY